MGDFCRKRDDYVKDIIKLIKTKDNTRRGEVKSGKISNYCSRTNG